MAEKQLSIVIPTCQRAELLEQCFFSIERGTQADFELIVVDGASTDGTADVVQRARHRLGDRIQYIREEQRQGFTKAVNRGFRAATGRFVTWLNDDARPRSGTLDEAVGQMQSAKADVGLLAMFHHFHATRNVAYSSRIGGRFFSLLHVRGTLYANFGLGRRETFASLGYFDERFYFYGADPDFSLKVWHAGMKVEPAYATAIDHDELADDRRGTDEGRGKSDNDALFAKWDLPPKSTGRNDFDPRHPCTLRGRRDQAAIAV